MRVSFNTLRCGRKQGGLAILGVILYYQACHLSRVVEWCRHEGVKQWVYIEMAISTYLVFPGANPEYRLH